MILMSKYKGQHGGKTGSKNSGRGLPPPFSGNARKKFFFLREGFPNRHHHLAFFPLKKQYTAIYWYALCGCSHITSAKIWGFWTPPS